MSKYGSDSWRRYSLKGVCWCVDGNLTWGVSLAGQVNRLGIGENYVCYLVIVVIFMGLGGAELGKFIAWREAVRDKP